MSEKPLVSIIVRTKDRPRLLKRALSSIYAQTYRPIEVVLVNDGGCDLDVEEIENILGDVSLNYIKLEKNMGRARAGNVGIENSKGEYIGFLDDDDIYYPDHLETLVYFLESSQNYKVAYTDSKYIFQECLADRYVTFREEVPYSEDFDRQKLLISNYIPMINLVFKKSLVEKAGFFDEELEAHEDWDLWLRLSQYSDFHHIKKITAEISMRTDGSTLTSANRIVFLKTARIIHKKYSSFVTDSTIFERQNMVEWLLCKEVVSRGEKLENPYIMDIAETLIHNKDVYIGNLETALKDKDVYIGNLETALKDKDVYIGNLETALKDKDSTLNQIFNSHGWKALVVYYKLRDKILPINTKRRLFFRIIFNAIINPKGFFRNINKTNFKKFIYYLRVSEPNILEEKVIRKVTEIPEIGKTHHISKSNNFTMMQPYSLPKPAQNKFYPKVSIIVPNYNHAHYLRQRLDSIYQQTYKNVEVILLDDGSTDESIEILKEYEQRYSNFTRCYFNDKNSGSVFHQWKRGIELAQGELIWIAESDDYCSENFLEELVKFFVNEAVMLSFCRTVFVDGDTSQQIWSLEKYLADLIDPTLWSYPFIKSAHRLVNIMWAIKNIIPNVSSAVFRNPGKLELLEDKNWVKMRICGDWIFYLHLVRGGLVAYSPNATNFFRIHKKNTSVSTYKQDIYYREHERVAEEVLKLYRLEDGILEKQRHVLELHWRLHHTNCTGSNFKQYYDYERFKHLSKSRKMNLLMVSYALSSGGGEVFPIRLSNLLKSAGYSVTFLNCNREPSQPGIRKMLRKDIPLLELDHLDKLNMIIDDMGIEIVHSHHAWVDVSLCSLLRNNPNCKIVVTTHGMYDMMSNAEIKRIIPLLNERVNKFVYIADKNLKAFESSIIEKNRFVKIYNAVENLPITPVRREELNISEDSFVLCLVSRAIPEKGWEEGIKAVKIARELSGKDIHLLLVGNGPEYERLKDKIRNHFIHFLGFRANVCSYFATSDLGFLPSRFQGESFPLVIIECLHANRPMLASDIGEIRKMLETESGLAGIVFPLDNWRLPIHLIAELIAEYATNRDLYSEKLRRVPEARRKFDIKKMLYNYEMVYQEIMGLKVAAYSH